MFLRTIEYTSWQIASWGQDVQVTLSSTLLANCSLPAFWPDQEPLATCLSRRRFDVCTIAAGFVGLRQ